MREEEKQAKPHPEKKRKVSLYKLFANFTKIPSFQLSPNPMVLKDLGRRLTKNVPKKTRFGFVP